MNGSIDFDDEYKRVGPAEQAQPWPLQKIFIGGLCIAAILMLGGIIKLERNYQQLQANEALENAAQAND